MTTESEQALKKRKIEKETQPTTNMAHELLPVYSAGTDAAFGDYKVSFVVRE